MSAQPLLVYTDHIAMMRNFRLLASQGRCPTWVEHGKYDARGNFYWKTLPAMEQREPKGSGSSKVVVARGPSREIRRELINPEEAYALLGLDLCCEFKRSDANGWYKASKRLALGLRHLVALDDSESHANPSRPGARPHRGWGLGVDKWGWADFTMLCLCAKHRLWWPQYDMPRPTAERHMMFLVYSLVRGAWDDAQKGRASKDRFQFAGIFSKPSPEEHGDDDDPL